MAEATRFKDLLEAQKKTDLMMQSDSLKRDAAEARLQEKIDSMDNKYDNLAKTLASIQLQLSNIDKGKSNIEDESILGDPTANYMNEGNYSRVQQQQIGRWTAGYSGNHQGGQFKQSMPKIDFPKFDGSNPRSWFLQCNNYFRMVPPMAEEQRVRMACMSFEGRARQWYQNSEIGDNDLTWDQFMGIVSARFEDIKEAKVIAEFNKLKQTGTYDEYVDRFEELKACLLMFNNSRYTEEHFMASFVSGVSEDMQAAIELVEPKTLKQTVDVGRKHLLTMEAITKRLRNTNKANANPQNCKKWEPPQPNTQEESPNVYQKAPIRLLTSAEMADRREKGLCFNCEEKFVHGHRCKNVFKCMMMNEQDELLHYQKVEGTANEYEQEFVEPMEEIPIAINTINCKGGVGTMNLIGKHGSQDLDILIDSGSTVSFIQESIARKLGCKFQATKPVMVRVAGDMRILCNQEVKCFQWTVQGHQFEYSLRVLDKLGCDLILGCDWVSLSSPVEFDFPRRTITVYEERVKLQGTINPALSCNLISGSVLFHMLHNEEDMVYLKLQPFRQNSVSLRRNLKLSAKYYGPYRNLERVGSMAYKIELPNSSKIHPIFHVSLLKKYIGRKHVPLTNIPTTGDDGEFSVLPTAAVDSRVVTRSQTQVPQVLVMWANSSATAATWKDTVFMCLKFGSLGPWGQGPSSDGGIVSNMNELEDGFEEVAVVEREGNEVK